MPACHSLAGWLANEWHVLYVQLRFLRRTLLDNVPHKIFNLVKIRWIAWPWKNLNLIISPVFLNFVRSVTQHNNILRKVFRHQLRISFPALTVFCAPVLQCIIDNMSFPARKAIYIHVIVSWGMILMHCSTWAEKAARVGKRNTWLVTAYFTQNVVAQCHSSNEVLKYRTNN